MRTVAKKNLDYTCELVVCQQSVGKSAGPRLVVVSSVLCHVPSVEPGLFQAAMMRNLPQNAAFATGNGDDLSNKRCVLGDQPQCKVWGRQAAKI